MFWTSTPGFTELTVVRELGQPSLIIDPDRPKIARYGINVDDVGSRRAEPPSAARPPPKSSKAKNSSTWSSAWSRNIRSSAREIGNLLVPAPGRPADSALRARHHQRIHRRILHLSRKQFALHRHPVFRHRARPRRHRQRRSARRRQVRAACPKAIASIGAANTASYSKRNRSSHHRPARHLADLPDPVRALRQFQIPGHHRARRRSHRTRRRASRAQTHAHTVQRLERPRACWRCSASPSKPQSFS